MVVGAALALAAGAVHAADPRLDAVNAKLERIFATKEFETKKLGRYRWNDDGRSYSTLEPAAGGSGGKDIVRYDLATGKRSVLVAASALVPAAGAKPLEVEDYYWSKDGKRLLVFTNTKRVW